MTSAFKLSAFLLAASVAGLAQASDSIGPYSDVSAPSNHAEAKRTAGLYDIYRGYGSNVRHSHYPTRYDSYGYRDYDYRGGYGYGYGPSPRRSYSNRYAPTLRRGYVDTYRRGYGYGSGCSVPAYRSRGYYHH